ncbi:sugar phosphate isomerase/epimerase family protein [Pseudoxanthobacter sp.]|uniref:sugar phosphate isomerase/epimerase family protein n=1 Tax=Pseudoxanthobacter sp. TaxID=1925742 RepID=UPI002FE3D339
MRRLDASLCSVNTATLGFRAPLEDTVEAVARAGFGAIAPWRREIEGRDVARLARHIRAAGLSVSGYCRSADIPAATAADFAAGLETNRRAIEAAAELGATAFILVVGGLPGDSRDLAAARAQVREGIAILAEQARACGVRLALEPLHPMYAADRACLNTLAQALDLCAALEPAPAGPPVLGVAVDVYHVWWDPLLAEGIARAGAERRLLAFHVCDWRRPTRDMLNDRAMMGDGVIDIRAIRSQVEAAGFGGFVETEIFSVLDWWRRPPEEVLATCRQRLETVV